ncbi:hypothetical protein mRhiFer1_008474 [Rhinolophus ferrumequinum]|uniref:Uncharacterized protein n=1 Tax=Rhinolophus ferrumequinum TaxID=59479 RepID=A0A7J7UX98_RHIFE|nr:hypothetical protein mRhiFer1_008474 [Rhinolophus ferrumequinum]
MWTSSQMNNGGSWSMSQGRLDTLHPHGDSVVQAHSTASLVLRYPLAQLGVRELPELGEDEDPLACFLTMLHERESHLYCIYLEKGLQHFIWVHFRAAVQYYGGERQVACAPCFNPENPNQ